MTEDDVPYSTTDKDDEWCGHIWRQRHGDSNQWGFAWEVTAPYSDGVGVAFGWRRTYAAAEKAMRECLEAKKGKPCPQSE